MYHTNDAIPTSFNMSIRDISGVTYALTTYTHPSISMSVQQINHKDNNIKIPSNTVIYDDLNVTFIVDSLLKNYVQVWQWMLRCKPLIGKPALIHELRDVTVHILDSHKQPVFDIIYHDAFPYMLGALSYGVNLSDADVISCDVTLAYQDFAFKFYDNEG